MYKTKFCIFGLQRSGTSFIEKLIALNFTCVISNGANWKHSLDYVDTFTSFNIYKNPYTWVESVIFRDPADILLTHPHLLSGERSEKIGHDSVNLRELCKLYNTYCNNWLEHDDVTVVKYEDIIQEKTRNVFLDSLLPIFESRNHGQYMVPAPGSLFMSEGFSNDMLQYYVNQKPTRLSRENIEVVNQNISNDVFEKLGYEKLDV